MREIVLDTETTGTEALKGDRIVEIGCVELVNYVPTGRSFHTYLNPERAMSEGAFRVHGLSDAFLADKPRFAEKADEFAAFIDGARLIIHNAAFDVGFINMENGRIGRPALESSLIVDTLTMARRKHPGASNSLDALCSRYGIDNSKRTRHGALLDAEILAEVYIELIGGKQADLGLAMLPVQPVATEDEAIAAVTAPRPRRLPPRLSPEDLAEHARFAAKLADGGLWKNYPSLLPSAGEADG